MALYFGKILSQFQWPEFQIHRWPLLLPGLILGGMVLSAQSVPFTSSYNAGVLSSDRLSSRYESAILQPSILPDLPSAVVSSHIQSRFSGFGIYSMGFHLVSPLQDYFGLGVSVLSLGAEDYRSTDIVVSSGKKLNPHWGIGVSQRFQRSRIGDEGRPWNGSSSVAASYHPGRWGIAVNVSGLMPWNRTNNYDRFSVQLASHISWPTKTHLYVLADYSADELIPIIGIRQIVLRDVDVFGAFRLYPARYGLGFSLPLTRALRSVISSQYHPVLGWSPAVGISYVFKSPSGN